MGTKNSGRRSRLLDPEQLRKFRTESSPQVEKVFQRQMKITQEMIKRLEERMFSDDFWDTDKKTGLFNSELARHVKDLGQVLANLGSLYLRIQKEAKAAADMMTFDDKIDAIKSFTEEMGRIQAMTFLTKIYPVIHELEQKQKSRQGKKKLRDASRDSLKAVQASPRPSDNPPSD